MTPIKTYRGKTESPCEAMRLTPETMKDALTFLSWKAILSASWPDTRISFRDGAGLHRSATDGDWIIRYADGTFGLKSDSGFQSQFEEAGPAPANEAQTPSAPNAVDQTPEILARLDRLESLIRGLAPMRPTMPPGVLGDPPVFPPQGPGWPVGP
jgi:hypothetical protein